MTRPPTTGSANRLGVAELAWRSRDGQRLLTWAALAGLALAGLLAVFGMPPVKLHGPLHHLGVMGPLCGMTRAVAAFTRGDVASAWAYNPAGLLLVPGAVVVVVRAAYGAFTGRWLHVTVRLYARGWLLLAVAVGALAVRQQLNAQLLG